MFFCSFVSFSVYNKNGSKSSWISKNVFTESKNKNCNRLCKYLSAFVLLKVNWKLLCESFKSTYNYSCNPVRIVVVLLELMIYLFSKQINKYGTET